MNIRKLTTMAMLTAISMIVFLIEAQIPLPIAIPGVKLGIANVITLFAIWTLGRREAGAILMVRALGQSHHRQCHGHAVQSGRRGAVLARHVPAQAPRGPEADLGDERLRRLGPQCRPAGCGCLGLRHPRPGLLRTGSSAGGDCHRFLHRPMHPGGAESV